MSGLGKWNKSFLVAAIYLCFHSRLCSSLRCYQGQDDNYQEVDCSLRECYNVGCLCLKVPDYQGRTVRSCHVNPFNAQRPGCLRRYYQGDHEELVCTCQGDLCNAARRDTPAAKAATVAVAALAAWTGRKSLL